MKKINKIKRNNAKIYPIYKMLSWDLLFFYSVEFLFYTITKKISASEVLIISGLYILYKTLMEIPAVAITDYFGKRKSIIIANLFRALGMDIKTISESNLLYDSVSTKGGEGLYSKIEAKGESWYYLLDGIASLTAGYLFVINNYLPMLICLLFIVISTILSFKFKDVYEIDRTQKRKLNMINTLKEYKKDLISSFKFIFKSRRMKAFIFFQLVFYSTINIVDTYQSDLLVDIGIPEEQYSMIISILTLIAGISISLKNTIEKKLKNRTLSFLSLMYICSCIVVGAITSLYSGKVIIPIILGMLVIQRVSSAIWYVLETKYLNNFTQEETRNKIIFGYEMIGAISAGIFSVLGGLLLNVYNIRNAFLILGLVSLAFMIIALDYMRSRFGLKPEEYRKEDIEFEIKR